MKDFEHQNNIEDETIFIEKEDGPGNIKEILRNLMDFLEEDDIDLEEQDDSVNISLNGSPVYPRIYTGDSARPLMGQYPESEYKDDNNIHHTWLGLMSFYG